MCKGDDGRSVVGSGWWANQSGSMVVSQLASAQWSVTFILVVVVGEYCCGRCGDVYPMEYLRMRRAG